MKYRTNGIAKVILTLSMTTGTAGTLDAAAPYRMRPEPDVSSLTEGAQAVFAQVKTLRTEIHGKVDAICGTNSALRDKVHAAMDATLQDKNLSDDEKRKAIHAVRSSFQEQMAAERSRMRTCFDTNEAAVSVWRNLGKTLHDACLPDRGERGRGGAKAGRGFGPDGRGPGAGAGPLGPRLELTEAQKQEFESKLLSSPCSQAIASVQEKMK